MVSAGASRADADADVEASAALASDRRDHRTAAADARRRITEEGAALGTRCAQQKSFLQLVGGDEARGCRFYSSGSRDARGLPTFVRMRFSLE
jgi:hypothetical protein